MTAEENAGRKIRNGKYQKAHRDKIRQQTSPAVTSKPFANHQVKGKLMKRAREGFIGTDDQNREVLKCLLNEFNKTAPLVKTSNAGLPVDVVHRIQMFYLNDDISSSSPNTKDFCAVTESGKKKKISVKFLQYPIKEVYGMFKSENPAIKVGLTTFFKCRPPNVKLFSNTPHNVCSCIIHENLRCRLSALKRSITAFSDLEINSGMHLNFTCDVPSADCFSISCDRCENFRKIQCALDLVDDTSQQISWTKWIKVNKNTKENRTSDNLYCSIEKVSKSGDLKELIQEIYELVPEYLDHQQIKMNQSNSYKEFISQSMADNSKKAVLVFDFAEKFKVTHQNEPQSAHYGQKPITIFTVAEYHRRYTAKALVSDVEKQTKDIIFAFIDRILWELPSTTEEVEIFTDNAGSQFKNQFAMEALKTLQIRHDKKISWNFFAPMHGKSVVDGTGGNIKRFVKQRIIAQELLLKNAADFVAIAETMEQTKVLLMTEDNIKRRNNQLDLKTIIQKARPIPEIKKKHRFEVQTFEKAGKKIEKIVSHKFTTV